MKPKQTKRKPKHEIRPINAYDRVMVKCENCHKQSLWSEVRGSCSCGNPKFLEINKEVLPRRRGRK